MFGKRKKTTPAPEPVREKQVRLLAKLIDADDLAVVIDDESGTRGRRKTAALLKAALRNSTPAEIDAAYTLALKGGPF
jgi:hypothetical protein